MLKNEAQDLFHLQVDLIDAKVEVAVSSAIDRVVDQIRSLKDEMHDWRHEMNERFSSLDNRVIAIETKLGMVNKSQEEIRSKFIDYSFKAGWLVLGVFLTYLLAYAHIVMK